MVQGKKLAVVFDSKFYHSEVPLESVYKLLEDAELREKENVIVYPLLILSQWAKQVEDESEHISSTMEKRLRTVQLQTEGAHEEYLDQPGDYQTAANEALLREAIRDIVKLFTKS